MGVVADLWFAASLCTYTLVPLLFVTFAVFPYSARPGLPIVQLACPSTFIQIGWVLMATCFFVSWSLSPDVAEGSDDEVFVSGLLSRGIIFAALHSIVLSPVRLLLRKTTSKWSGVAICECAKGVTIAGVLSGIVSMVDSGTTSSQSPFFAFIVLLLIVLISVSVARLGVMVKVALGPGGLTAANFNSVYFGTDIDCPFTPYLFAYEKKRGAADGEGLQAQEGGVKKLEKETSDMNAAL